jgi:hypothetical protein
MYVNGDAIDFAVYYETESNLIQYTINKKGKLTTNPGAFFYYTELSPDVTDGELSISITSSTSPTSFFSVVKNDMKLWLVTDTTCAQVKLRGPDAPQQVGAETKFKIPDDEVPAGSYYVVSVKYDTDTVENMNGGTVDFTFTPTFDGVAPSTGLSAAITLAPKFP